MEKLFHRILLLVDFSSATRDIIDKTADMAHRYGCSLHLLHVSPVRWTPFASVSEARGIQEEEHPGMEELEFHMNGLVDHVREMYDGRIDIDYSLC
jgi:nucleotide-binding universal stress UspA family protein